MNSREQQHWSTGNDALASLDIIAIRSNKSNQGEVKRFLRIKALVIHTQQTATPKQTAKRIATATPCAPTEETRCGSDAFYSYTIVTSSTMLCFQSSAYGCQSDTWCTVLSFKHTAFSTSIAVFTVHIDHHIGVWQSRDTQSNLYPLLLLEYCRFSLVLCRRTMRPGRSSIGRARTRWTPGGGGGGAFACSIGGCSLCNA